MFAATTKAVVKNLGAEGDLISNQNVNEKTELLTLVKVRENTLWPVSTYSITDLTLLDLLEDQDYSPEYSEEVLVEDFKNEKSVGGFAEAVVDVPDAGVPVGDAKASLSLDMKGGASAVTLKKKTVDMDKLKRSCRNKKIKTMIVDLLKVKEAEKLAFVYQKVYNSGPVTLFDKVGQDGGASAACKIFFSLSLAVKGKRKKETSFIVPKESTFAYSLMEIETKGGTLGIPVKIRKVNQGWFSSDGEDEDFLQQVKMEIKMKEGLLQPLVDLPESTRQDLLKTLCELVDDREARALLLDQSSPEVSDCPQSLAVSTFRDLLKDASTSQKDAVLLLVNMMDTLPDGAPAVLITCSPETLSILKQMVSSLKEDGQAKLPEVLPPPLQEDGELHWAAELLSMTSDTLRKLSQEVDRPELQARVLLEVLCLMVQGLSLMRPKTSS